MKIVHFCLLVLMAFPINALAQSSDLQGQAEKENQTWEDIVPTFSGACAHGKQPTEVGREEVIAFSDCITEIIKQKIVPIAVYPDLVVSMRKIASDNAQAFQNGRISRSEYIKLGNENYNKYLVKMNSRISSGMQYSNPKY